MGLWTSKPVVTSTEHEETPCDEEFPDLLCVLKSGEGSDLVLRSGNETFRVHSKILEIHSDTFKAMFDSIGQDKEIPIRDVAPGILKYLLHFIYSGRLPKITMHHTVKLLEAAGLYEIQPLERKCLQLVKNGMKEEYVCDILTYAHSKQHGELKDIVIGYLITNKKFLLSEQWRTYADQNKDLSNDILVAFVRNT